MDIRNPSLPLWSWIVLLAVMLPGCAMTTHFAYTNVALTDESLPAPKASFKIAPRPTKRQPEVLVLLALSGGGSRAAYFSARSMQALERVTGTDGKTVNVLNEVDLISSVSGGSLAAAYYASSADPGAAKVGQRVWNRETIDELMSNNYIGRWIGNWFWPVNIAKFWLTAYDRTDIMAQTFADNFFDSTATGIDLRMRDLNPARPNLVLNSTIGNRSYDMEDKARAKRFGSVFTFTDEDFRGRIKSSIGDYELGRAVMASATFPAAFNYMTLRDFDRPDCEQTRTTCYLHLFDGGNSDNLGLLSLKRVLLANNGENVRKYKRIVVILVDSFRESRGVDPASPNPRGPLDYIVDTNFMDATDSLLEANRENLVKQFFMRNLFGYASVKECARDNLPANDCKTHLDKPEKLNGELEEKLFFFHVDFDAVSNRPIEADPLKQRLNAIPTTFKFADGEMAAINDGVTQIFGKDGPAYPCVQRVADLIIAPDTSTEIDKGTDWCGGGTEEETASRALKFKK